MVRESPVGEFPAIDEGQRPDSGEGARIFTLCLYSLTSFYKIYH
jgi:hypothetical protein